MVPSRAINIIKVIKLARRASLSVPVCWRRAGIPVPSPKIVGRPASISVKVMLQRQERCWCLSAALLHVLLDLFVAGYAASRLAA